MSALRWRRLSNKSLGTSLSSSSSSSLTKLLEVATARWIDGSRLRTPLGAVRAKMSSSSSLRWASAVKIDLPQDRALVMRSPTVDFHVPQYGWRRKLHSTSTSSSKVQTALSIAGASPRQMAELEEKIWSAVSSNVVDPETSIDLKKLGWVQRRLAVSEPKTRGDASKIVQVLLQPPTLLHPSLEQLKSLVRVEAEGVINQWIIDNGLKNSQTIVNVEVVPQKPVPWVVHSGLQDEEDVATRLGPGLANVSHFVAVYSCKGGVGKSTVAVNLAYELARLGGRVGLLDVDIYGPSLPLLIHPDDPVVRKSPLGSSMVFPIEHKGVKLLSMGFVSSNSGVPSVLRGPMAGRVVTQLLKGTDWGELDVLVLDLPPGTGDVQLTVCQEIDLSCAVCVTTPSRLAIADARKGISMFASMGINTVATVENMSYFECDTGVRHYPFGKGFSGDLVSLSKEDFLISDKINPQHVCQLPISEIANEANEIGVPICISRPAQATRELQAFQKLAEIISREIISLPYREPDGEGTVVVEDQTFELSSIQMSEDKGSILIRFFSDAGALQKRIPPQNLRSRDPKTGLILDEHYEPTKPSPESKATSPRSGMVSIHRASTNDSQSRRSASVPERIEKKGRSGFDVTWNDGSRYLYSRRAIALAAGGKVVSA